jgi:hypothetical protein
MTTKRFFSLSSMAMIASAAPQSFTFMAFCTHNRTSAFAFHLAASIGAYPPLSGVCLSLGDRRFLSLSKDSDRVCAEAPQRNPRAFCKDASLSAAVRKN